MSTQIVMTHNVNAYFYAGLNVVKKAKVSDEIADIAMEIAIFNHDPNGWGAKEFLSNLSTNEVEVRAFNEDKGLYVYGLRGKIDSIFGHIQIVNVI